MMMKTKTRILASLALAGLALPAVAGVVQTLGSGSAVQVAQYTASFEANLGLGSGYLEGGLLFSYSGTGNNAGCGYAGVDCVAPGGVYSEAFSGNYMATNGSNAYISIRSTGADLTAIEFAADTGYETRVYGFWQTYRGTLLTGSGNFDLGPAGVGGVVGLRDLAGFDEVRYFSFAADGRSSGFSAPALDSVRASAVPEPASLLLLLLGAGLLGLAATRRRGAKPGG